MIIFEVREFPVYVEQRKLTVCIELWDFTACAENKDLITTDTQVREFTVCAEDNVIIVNILIVQLFPDPQ